MTRKKLLTVIVCIVASAAILAAIIYAVRYAIAYVRHPAVSHDDHVYDSNIVIDNKTPYEYDSEIANRNPYLYPISNSTLAQVQQYFGNEILREKDGYLYTVYSSPDNHLLYVFFIKAEDGTWMYDHCIRTSMVYFHDDLMQEIYEHDAPREILGDVLPEETISAEYAANAAQSAASYLSNIRYILGMPDIRHLVADGIYAQAYRMTVEGVYIGTQYIDFYVHHDGTGTLIYRRYNSSDMVNIKGIFEDITYELSAEETNSLVKVWVDNEFERLPCTHPYESTSISDGRIIYLEGIDGCKKYSNGETIYSWYYNMTHLHDQRVIYPELSTIKDAMVAMVESKGTEVRFNRTSEEEKLRSNQAAD